MEQNEKTLEVKEEKKYLKILLRIMRNGYSLDVEDEGYMYHDEQSLLEGFLVHVGMNRVGEMTKKEMTELLKAYQDGSAEQKLQEEVNTQRAEIERLNRVIRGLKMEIKNLKGNVKFY